MGKIKTVVMGDEIAEEATRKKAEAKREQKRAEKAATVAKKESLKMDKLDVLDTEPLNSGNLDQETKEESRHSGNSERSVEDSRISSSKGDAGHGQHDEKAKEMLDTASMTEKQPKISKKKTIEAKYRFTSGKKYSEAQALVDSKKSYPVSDALALVKKTSYSKFDGSVEVHFNLIDKNLRGIVSLPHGTGKQIKVAIADDGLITNLEKGGKIEFDILVASPDMMPKLAKVAKILGPKGLMPNPKTNTIGENPAELVKILTSSVSWKTQPDFPIVHAVIGKVSFESKKLEENFAALTKSIGKDKIVSVFVKATMGPSIKLTL